MANTKPSNYDDVEELLKKILVILRGEGESGGAAISGDVTIEGGVTIPGNVTVTGGVTASGAVADNAAETQNPVPMAGKAVVAASYAPAYTAGDRAVIPVDKDSGGVLCHTRKLTVADDKVNARGSVAHDGVDDGEFPVKIGGVCRNPYFTSLPTAVVDGDRANFISDAYGRQQVVPSFRDPFTILSSAARTATPAAVAVTNHIARGVVVIVNVTALTATGTLTVTIDGQDPVSSAYYNILTGAAISATGIYAYRVHPAITPVANVAASDLLPRTWRVVVTHGNGVSITYSVGSVLTL